MYQRRDEHLDVVAERPSAVPAEGFSVSRQAHYGACNGRN